MLFFKGRKLKCIWEPCKPCVDEMDSQKEDLVLSPLRLMVEDGGMREVQCAPRLGRPLLFSNGELLLYRAGVVVVRFFSGFEGEWKSGLLYTFSSFKVLVANSELNDRNQICSPDSFCELHVCDLLSNNLNIISFKTVCT